MVQVAGVADTVVARATDRESLLSRVRAVDVVLVAAIVLAAVLRFWHLGGPSVWYDEWVTTDDLSKRFAQMLIVAIPHNEGSPPLYFLLGWFWVRIFGAGDTALRSLSALIGIATVPAVYVLAIDLRLRRTVARIAALLVAVNPLLVWYSQEARPYALLALLGTVTLICCVRAIHDPRTRTFVVWGIAAAAALCTHYFAFLVVVPEAVWLGLATRGHLRELVRGCIPIAVVALPLGVLAIAQQGQNQSWIRGYPLELRLAEAGRSALLGPAEPFGDRLWPALAVVVVLSVVLVWRFGDRHERRIAAILGAVGTSGYLMALASGVLGSDYFLGRNLIVSLIPFVVVVAIGLGSQRLRWAGVALAVVLCAGWAGAVVEAGRNGDLQKTDWRAVAHVVGPGSEHRAVVVDSYLGFPLLRYVEGSRALQGKKRADVDELELLFRIPAPGPRCGRWSGLGCETFLWARLSKPIARQFRFVGRREVAGFVVNRYRARHRVAVSRHDLLQEIRERGSFVMLPDENLRTYRH